MPTKLNILTIDGTSLGTVDVPKICPYCNEKAIPILVHQTSIPNQADLNVAIAFTLQCIICGKFYLAQYRVTRNNTRYANIELIPADFKPKLNVNIPENIRLTSPKFVEIYEQSLYAEKYELSHLIGIGFRKATEFLLKDYAINLNHDDKDRIVKMPLMQVITEFFEQQPELLVLAKATTWLGNDETHYNKIHTDKDLSDLKKFLHVLISTIDNRITIDEAISFVQN